MRQMHYRLLGARKEAAEVQLDRIRDYMRVRGVSIENGEVPAVLGRNVRDSLDCDILIATVHREMKHK